VVYILFIGKKKEYKDTYGRVCGFFLSALIYKRQTKWLKPKNVPVIQGGGDINLRILEGRGHIAGEG
jgi:hypothetical protein